MLFQYVKCGPQTICPLLLICKWSLVFPTVFGVSVNPVNVVAPEVTGDQVRLLLASRVKTSPEFPEFVFGTPKRLFHETRLVAQVITPLTIAKNWPLDPNVDGVSVKAVKVVTPPAGPAGPMAPVGP